MYMPITRCGLFFYLLFNFLGYENLNYRFWVRDVERHSHRPDVFRYDVNTGCVNITRRVLSNIHIQVHVHVCVVIWYTKLG